MNFLLHALPKWKILHVIREYEIINNFSHQPRVCLPCFFTFFPIYRYRRTIRCDKQPNEQFDNVSDPSCNTQKINVLKNIHRSVASLSIITRFKLLRAIVVIKVNPQIWQIDIYSLSTRSLLQDGPQKVSKYSGKSLQLRPLLGIHSKPKIKPSKAIA